MKEKAAVMAEKDTPNEEEIHVKKLLLSLVAALAALFGAVAAVLYFFKDALMHLSKLFVDALGGIGVAIGYFLPDAFAVPLPNDAFTLFGLAGGLSFWSVVFWGSLGSLSGGTTGYFIGRYFQKTLWYQKLMKVKGKEIQEMVRKYGAWALAITAITPLPYSLGCWASGAANLPFKTFLWVSLLRIPKVWVYLLAISGALTAFGL